MGKCAVWIREDTVLHNFLLYCPKCKQEALIDLQHFSIIRLHKPDAKTQS
ncbi:cysteine-rich KTR domain-containing protein [Blautia massiliensis (ex Durand et al. 2017)]